MREQPALPRSGIGVTGLAKDVEHGCRVFSRPGPLEPLVVVRPLAEPRDGAFVASADEASVVRGTYSPRDDQALGRAHSTMTQMAEPAVLAVRESTESPHSIALQVATVRYIELMKPPLTCDYARKPRSRNG